MADQPTVSGIAAQQLKPLQNNNIGAIVQENIRYWNQVDTEEEAARKAAAAREKEFNRQQKKDADKRFDDYIGNLAIDESEGYFNNQSAKLLGMTNDIILKNANPALNGTYEERLAAIQENQKWRNRTSAFSKFNKASNEITKNIDPDNYNPALDYETKKLADSIITGDYLINERGKVAMTNPLNGEDIEVEPTELLGTIKSMKYSGKVDLVGLATKEMDAITQEVNNGNIKVSDLDKEAGLKRAMNVLSDERVFRDFAYRSKFGGMEQDPTVYKNFTTDQKKQLAEDFYETYFETQFKKVNNSLDNANTRSKIRNRENVETTPNQTIAQATDNGKPVILKEYSNIMDQIVADGSLKPIEDTSMEITVYNATDTKGDLIIIGDKTGSRYRYEVQGFVMDEKTKKLGLIGSKLESVKDGKPEGGKQFFKEVRTQAINWNPVDVNQAAAQQVGTIKVDGKDVMLESRNEEDIRKIINNIKGTTTGGAAAWNTNN
tara:strand:+ start:6256 stop:7731 length:1476 start_codon:yes stop_codon:yes gene_type:complete